MSYKPWYEPTTINPQRIAVSDTTLTLAVPGEDRRNPPAQDLNRVLGEVAGSQGSWKKRSALACAKTGRPSKPRKSD